jgi:hypothetical protein
MGWQECPVEHANLDASALPDGQPISEKEVTQVSWAAIWAAIQQLISGLGDKDKWKMSIDGVKNEPITAVHASATGIKFEFKVGARAMSLEAIPGDATHAAVKVNGKLDSTAQLVFSLKHQPLKPIIVVFEFKNITLGGATKRYRFDNPK